MGVGDVNFYIWIKREKKPLKILFSKTVTTKGANMFNLRTKNCRKIWK